MKTVREITRPRTLFATFFFADPPQKEHRDAAFRIAEEANREYSPHVILIGNKKSPILTEERKKYWLKQYLREFQHVFVATDSLTEAIYPYFKEYKKINLFVNAMDADAYQKIFDSISEDCHVVVHPISLNEKGIPAGVTLEEFSKTSILNESDTRKLYMDIKSQSQPSAETYIKNIPSKRNKFFLGESHRVGEVVRENNQLFEIIDRGSNYVTVVDSSGKISRKFIENLIVEDKPMEFKKSKGLNFKGYTPSKVFLSNNNAATAFESTISAFNQGLIEDTVAILKSMKLADEMLNGQITENNLTRLKYSLGKIGQLEAHSPYINQFEEKVQGMIKEDKAAQLQAAKIIAGAVGSTTSGNDAEAIVNNALKKAKTTSNSTQKKILKDMLVVAQKVGLKYDQSLVESMDDRMAQIHKHYKFLKEKPTKEVLDAHKDMRKIGVDYSAKDVGGKRAMVADIVSHTHGPRSYADYRRLSKATRDGMNEQKLEELSTDTLKSYSDKAKTASVAGKKDPIKTALKRFKGQERVTDRIHSRELKRMDESEKRSNYDGPGKGKRFSEMSTDEHLHAIAYHHGEYNKIKSGKHKNSTLYKSTGTTDKQLHAHAKAYYDHKEHLEKLGSNNHYIKDSVDIQEVHKDPEYKTEIEVFGYDKLKKRLAAHTGIENYGDQEPGEPINLVDKNGTVIQNIDPGTAHLTKPGHSLTRSTDTHRRQIVKKLTNT